MEIKEFLNYRKELLKEAKDEDGLINESSFIQVVIPYMLDAKLIDNEDFTETYFSTEIDGSALKINGYMTNESGERLQLYILNNDSITPVARLQEIDLQISKKEYYDAIFKKVTNFINKAAKRYLTEIQDVGAINALINHLSSSVGLDQYDVIEIFLISATATVEARGEIPQPKRINFKDESIKVRYTKDRQTVEKEILIIKRLVDLNFLYNVMISQGSREALIIDFEENFNYKIEAIQAADEDNFESYLCVMPASILSQLYKRYSSRLLEKNVRSFLQFRNKSVNAGMKKTLVESPERFIAFNNGLTITASDKIMEKIENRIYIKSLTDFQIVNGGQTTASIYFSQKDGVDVSKVKVMAKINIAKNVSEENLEELISNISEFSNSQTRVSSVDLRSRNPQLTRIKALSESVMTPSGRKWFFEKSKGEFNTKIRIAGKSSKTRIEKEFPKEFRFTKEQLGKYYCSWGNEPYKVKKGGENIFRKFLEDITVDDNNKKVIIDRSFYEFLIAKIILFKSLENLHGMGKNAIGQLRSAVVPYTISILYQHTEGNKKNDKIFDLSMIWTKEGLESDLAEYLKDLMILVNRLIKVYSKSDDLGEYSKKKELWDAISSSSEVNHFIESSNSEFIFKKYCISKKMKEKKLRKDTKNKDVDFKHLNDNIIIHSKTADFYKEIVSLLYNVLSENDKIRLSRIRALIQNKEELSEDLIFYEEKLIHHIRVNNPEIFDEMNVLPNILLEETFKYIVKKYNSAISKSENILSFFEIIQQKAEDKNVKYASVYKEIGRNIQDGHPPTIKQIYYASYYVEVLLNER